MRAQVAQLTPQKTTATFPPSIGSSPLHPQVLDLDPDTEAAEKVLEEELARVQNVLKRKAASQPSPRMLQLQLAIDAGKAQLTAQQQATTSTGTGQVGNGLGVVPSDPNGALAYLIANAVGQGLQQSGAMTAPAGGKHSGSDEGATERRRLARVKPCDVEIKFANSAQ
eukprot:390350-Rhodomonas_salina.1